MYGNETYECIKTTPRRRQTCDRLEFLLRCRFVETEPYGSRIRVQICVHRRCHEPLELAQQDRHTAELYADVRLRVCMRI